MNTEALKKRQPAAWQMLSNDLTGKRVSNAYLFAGSKGNRKKEAAVLFVQSLVCPNTKDRWACGKCTVCQRIAENQYTDVRILDGSKESIKKEQVEALQEYFSGTALEKYGSKAYIINAADNMTIGAMNAILKFLEEPGQQITAVLCSDNPDRLLPTIRSRCKIVPFRSAGAQEREEEALEDGLEALDAHILTANLDEAAEWKRTAKLESYQNGVTYWETFITYESKKIGSGCFYLLNEAFGGKDKDKQKNAFPWFLRTGLIFVRDYTSKRRGLDPGWDKCLAAYNADKLRPDVLMRIILDGLDALVIHANTALLIDRFIYLVSEEEKRHE